MKLKFHPKRYDPYTKFTVYQVVGHELYGDSHVVARIFFRRDEDGRLGIQRNCYWPQINDDKEEDVIEIGPREGFRYLKTAQAALAKELEAYLTRG